MQQYLNLLSQILDNGTDVPDRTGTGARTLFGAQMRFDLSQGFPLLTTKRLNFHAIVVELLWFLRGDTNLKFLHEHGVHIWDNWDRGDGNLGPVYGKQWREWEATDWYDGHAHPYDIDQIANVITSLRNNPHGRRHIVTAWNPAEVDDMALPPCHCLFQFHVGNGKLSCQLYQRSCDMFIGVPFNIASYALLTHLMAHLCGYTVGDFIWTGGDCHIYSNHFDQAREQLQRTPGPLPTLHHKGFTHVEHLVPADIWLLDYNAQAHIKAPIAV